ncbi:Acriflavin resistance protein [Pseudovibrio sp. FO-BEG1]|uniref:efflux RND transporter permease subunit n=1 Tax=Pseudovibrio sp. (strain FO-BEG1) TaxID=911045 RepID=UPI000238D33F|nr:efflux RND transporter permease subunit [Pseudovibrio sp. FO-BEG1]AEV35790.1 Acriflavin resistance protein [Pseudovibrio sp. FO-BEG1]
MNSFTEIYVRRPVLASTISLMILALGLRAIFLLPVLEYPKTENAVITISTTLFGASAETVAGFITTPLEEAIAQANGIDYMTSTSASTVSTITVNLVLNYDADKALTEINTQISSVLDQLPQETQNPVLTIQIGETIDAMYIGFTSDVIDRNQLTDYIVRVVQPQVQAIEGVQNAELYGEKRFAIRVWLYPEKLAAYGLTGTDVSNALARNDFISGVGNTKGQMVQVELTANTNLTDVEEFRELAVTQNNGAIIRLRDVGRVVLGSEDYDQAVLYSGKPAVYLGVQAAPSANVLAMLEEVRQLVPNVQAAMPPGLEAKIVYDSGLFINAAIDEVISALVEALVIVTFVVFLFIGSPRTVAIPVIAIPLSLIGTFFIMLVLGYSINLLTLLALVLAIGLVVDDAIIVVEDVERHISEGSTPFRAAVQAGQDLGRPIIAMTVVLVAVYAPIGFQGGLTGALFTEFAFTVVGSVTISAIVALTLTPMMSSKILKARSQESTGWDDALTRTVDDIYDRFRKRYLRALEASLDNRPVVLTFAFLILASIPVLYSTSQQELAPQEDQGLVLAQSTPAPSATLQQKMLYTEEIYRIAHGYSEVEGVFQLVLSSSVLSGVLLTPWDERDKTATELQYEMQPFMEGVTGFETVMFQNPPLPGSSGLPVQFVIKTTQPVDKLYDVGSQVLEKAQNSGKFIFIDKDLKIDKPQGKINIDRDRVAELGLTLQDVGQSLTAMMSGGYINYFDFDGRSYRVIPQIIQYDRLNPEQLLDTYISVPNSTPTPSGSSSGGASAGSQTSITSGGAQSGAASGSGGGASGGGGSAAFSGSSGSNPAASGFDSSSGAAQSSASAPVTTTTTFVSGGSGGGGSSTSIAPQSTVVPLSSVATLDMQVTPEFIPHFQQQNSMTLSGVPSFGVPLAEALQVLQQIAAEELPEGYDVDYAQQSRQFEQESSGFVVTFAFALLIIFLTLAAQFESYRDPIIILVSVPMSIAGALFFINIGLGGASINIYTQVGIITLMGLISKHGILIVEVARELQENQGATKREAVVGALQIRLRAILMTTAAMVLGVIPLVLASGAGAASRFNMGLVIATGLSIGTLFTLFVVPNVYMLIAQDRSKLTQPDENAEGMPKEDGEPDPAS